MTEAERIEKDAEKYGFDVPTAVKAYIAGATAENERLQKELASLREQLAKSDEDKKEAYNAGLMCERILAKDEIEKLKLQLKQKEEENLEFRLKLKKHIHDEMDKLDEYNHEYFTLKDLLIILSA